MFEPSLHLCREPDGEYTLHAVTLTPNSCYNGGLALHGAPPGYAVIPEAEPVTLNINYISGVFCRMVVTPIRHSIPNLQLGPDQAHRQTREGQCADSLSSSLDQCVVTHEDHGDVVLGAPARRPCDEEEPGAHLVAARDGRQRSDADQGIHGRRPR